MIKQETIELVLYNCMGHKDKETVLIVTDEVLWDLGWHFYEGIKSLGIETIIMGMKPRSINGEEPPDSIAQAMRNVDIALLVTSKSLTHTEARRLACASERKVRIATMPGVDAQRINRLLNVNYDEMIRHGLALAEALKKSSRVEITTKAGTNLTFEIQGRQPLIDTGILSTPGAAGNLPAGEVYLAPLEGTANGTIVIDGSMSGIGRLTKPIKIIVKDGKAVEIDSEELNKILSPFDQSAYNIAEFGIGINPHAEIVGNILEDEKAINTVHIALGDNLSMGGKVKAPCHLDGIIIAPTIRLDGKAIPERLIKWYPTKVKKLPHRTKPSDTTYSLLEFEEIRSTIGPEMYQMLFDKSNDPQYILDLKSQVFLETNPAFLSLSGYKRKELVGKLKASDLTPPDAKPTLIQKIEDRQKGIERERYEFKMLTKSGEVKPIELSVHRLKIGTREVTLGSMRDISERLALEKALREKITDVALASNRLMALTEKIKNVPLLTSELLASRTEQELCEEAIKMLCDPQGLGYRNAAIYFITGDELMLAKCHKISSRKGIRRKINLDTHHRFALIARGDQPPVLEGNEIILPLKGKTKTLGVVLILVDPREKALMEANPPAKKGYQNVLETIVSTFGLLVENLRLNKTLETQSITDELTKVHNRRYFERALTEETQRARRYKRNLSLVLADLNDFKEINDTYGHKQGDIILTEVAHLLVRHSRKVDAVCRYGGDEFAIILPETSLTGALAKVRTLYQKIKDHRFANSRHPRKPFRITASFGIGVLSDKYQIDSEEKLLAAADRALYQAKDMKKEHIKACERLD